mgnify:CR=1 FL=1
MFTGIIDSNINTFNTSAILSLSNIFSGIELTANNTFYFFFINQKNEAAPNSLENNDISKLLVISPSRDDTLSSCSNHHG